MHCNAKAFCIGCSCQNHHLSGGAGPRLCPYLSTLKRIRYVPQIIEQMCDQIAVPRASEQCESISVNQLCVSGFHAALRQCSDT